MDKIFNFFSKNKSKEDIEKQKRNTVINTQNLQNLANINQSTNNTENDNLNKNDRKTINFSSQDFENIDKILNAKIENLNSEINISPNPEHQFNNTNINNYSNPGSINIINSNINNLGNLNQNQAQDLIIGNKIQSNNNFMNVNTIQKSTPVGDVVIVNSLENIKKANDGFYTKKYREQLLDLKSVSNNN